MRRFIPYFSYLRTVKTMLFCGILCGVISGAVGGLGLPLVVNYVIPRVLVADPVPTQATIQSPLKSNFVNRIIDKFLPSTADTQASTTPQVAVSAQATAPTRPKLTALQVWMIALWLPIIFLVRGGAGYLGTYLIQHAGVKILEGVRLEYFRKLQVLPLSFFHRFSTGDLITRGLNDTNQLQTTLTVISNDLIVQPATLVGTIIALGFLAYREQGVWLMFVCLMTVPLSIFPIRYVGKKLVKRAILLQAQAGSITDRFTENLAGIKEVRAFGLEKYEVDRFARLSGGLVRAQMKVVKYAQALGPSIEILSAVGISITFVYAYNAGVHSGSFLGIITALFLSYNPIKRLGAVSNELKRGSASLERLEQVLHEPVKISDPENPVPVNRLKGDVTFKSAGFFYKDGEHVLKNISVTIPSGTFCALVGPSGAGKTTFANLVPRFYDVTEGSLLIDGIDVRAMRFSDLRRNIALVSQDPVLFNDTIYANLLLGRPDATREEVIDAARKANADSFISAFPQGYDTLAGERGSLLSGGQKQRIAVARAFLRNAPILILDEATSALDSESEAAIQEALKKLVIGKTVIIIAHRFSTIKDASKILVFEKGLIVGNGTHSELYSSDALYRSLYDRQYTKAV
ncbi:MAG: ABC transporter ATP-binding protein [Verrucomicrobiota bacterium]|nr:MAG: ABC transporter ATP-binding protein [Verrucomicrobiota bacterium]